MVSIPDLCTITYFYILTGVGWESSQFYEIKTHILVESKIIGCLIECYRDQMTEVLLENLEYTHFAHHPMSATSVHYRGAIMLLSVQNLLLLPVCFMFGA